MRETKRPYWFSGRKLVIGFLCSVWLIIPIWLTAAQTETTQDFVAAKSEAGVDDQRIVPSSQVTLLPYGSAGFRYQVLPTASPIPTGFEQPGYNDAAWTQGAAAFGEVPRCTSPTTVQTNWAINTRLVTRKKFVVPPGAVNVRVTYIVDNDMERFWFNGTLVDQDQVHNGCPELDWRTVTIPNNLLVPGENTLAFQTLDRGQQTYFDVKVVATVADPEPGTCALISPTPVAWWNGQNNANDIVNGHHGYVSQNGVTFAPGKVGQAFNFDGIGNVMIPANANLTSNQLTLETWVFPTLYDSQVTSVLFRENYTIEIQDNGDLLFYIRGINGLPAERFGFRAFGGGSIPLNQWTHIALTYDGGRARTYLNGILKREITGLSGNPSASSSALGIGSFFGQTGTGIFDGKIDEVSYFNRALTPQEIASVITADNAGKCPPPPSPSPVCVTAPANLISWWQGEDDVRDVAGGNVGYASNNVTYTPGKVGKAFNFDGAGAVVIPSYDNLSQPNMTLGVWVYPTDYDSEVTTVLYRENYTIEIQNNGDLLFYIRGINGLPAERFGFRTVGGSSIPLNQWTHIAVSYDGSRAKTYLNGRLARTITGLSGNITQTRGALGIGASYGQTGTGKFDGLIDEVEYYGRALSDNELRSIVDAGNLGKCPLPPTPPPSCTAPTTELVSWFKAEGNANDYLGLNSGIASNTVSYQSGKVGQAFNFVGTGNVTVNNNGSLSAPNFTLQTWVYPTNYDSQVTTILYKSNYTIELQDNGDLLFYIGGINGLPAERFGFRTVGGQGIPLNQWTHLAITYDGSRAKVYINGRTSSTFTGLNGNVTSGNSPLGIGSGVGQTGTGIFDGKIDEIQYYSRALTDTEIRAIYNADNQGLCTAAPANRTPFDFDGDGKADISVFRPSDRVWYLNRSTAGFTAVQWGNSTDKIVPADYDGDGKSDVAIFRDGVWFILRSTNSNLAVANWGLAGDIPFPADYDNDGKADVAVFRPSDGTWYVQQSRDGILIAQFGTSADIPVVGDYDGDGKADLAVRRGSGGKDGVWYINNSSDASVRIVPFGFSDDLPVQADYDGDGKTDIAVFRNGIWYIAQSRDGFRSVQFGLAADIPTAADYDGDGKANVAVYRNGIWYVLLSSNDVSIQQFGLTGDRPLPSAFIP